MAIKKNFGGQTIRKPGAYSRSQTSSDAGGQAATTGIIFLLGEAAAGAGGANEGIQSFSSDAFNQLKAKYQSGPLVDAAKAALAPSRTPGINGASQFLIWQTNRPTAASLALASSYGTLTANEQGVGGNRITYQNSLSAESAPSVTGSAPVTAFGGLDGQTLIVRMNGGAAATCTFATPANMAAVLSQINSAITGLTATGATALTLTMNAAANHWRDGYGRTMEIDSASTALGLLFLSAGLTTASAEPSAAITLMQPRDSLTQTGVAGGDIAMTLGRDASGSCTAASVTTTASQMTLSQTGATPSSITLLYSNYPLMGNLADAINSQPGWTCTVSPTMRNQPSKNLDVVTSIGAYSPNANQPARLKQDAAEVAAYFSASMVALSAQATKGLPDAATRTNLAGGAVGSSASSDFDAGFSASLAQDYNVAVPCISQDAAADIAQGNTDPSSTYSIATVQAMLVTHLALRGNIKNKKEAQGVTGYRTAKKAASFAQAASLGDANTQMCMEDVLVVDSTNNLAWHGPHIHAALIAGMRCGSSTGEPLTHKVLNCQGVGHFVNPSTGVIGGDYNPQTDYDAAIDAGVTSAEPASGAFRVMLDNTTYGADANFVWNRGSVVEAAQFIAQTVRTDAELYAVGQKNAVITANGLKNRIRSKLVELFKAQVTSPSSDAPQGFREDTFIVTVVGNTATVQVEAKPVQGLDFVFITFTLGETFQSA